MSGECFVHCRGNNAEGGGVDYGRTSDLTIKLTIPFTIDWLVCSSGSEGIYKFVGEIVWHHESHPLLPASHLVAIQVCWIMLAGLLVAH